jgi:ankyrin repeat protein
VRVLVKELGAKVNHARHDGHATPLFIAACEGHVELLRVLVKELGADVNHVAHDGATTLFMAARQGHLDAVRVLVKELGADLNLAANDGITPMMIAANHGHDQVAKWLARRNEADIAVSGLHGTAAEVASSAELAQWLKSKQSCGNPDCAESGKKQCARCRKVRYCSRECQVAHHRIHKTTCRAPPDADE